MLKGIVFSPMMRLSCLILWVSQSMIIQDVAAQMNWKKAIGNLFGSKSEGARRPYEIGKPSLLSTTNQDYDFGDTQGRFLKTKEPQRETSIHSYFGERMTVNDLAGPPSPITPPPPPTEAELQELYRMERDMESYEKELKRKGRVFDDPPSGNSQTLERRPSYISALKNRFSVKTKANTMPNTTNSETPPPLPPKQRIHLRRHKSAHLPADRKVEAAGTNLNRHHSAHIPTGEVHPFVLPQSYQNGTLEKRAPPTQKAPTLNREDSGHRAEIRLPIEPKPNSSSSTGTLKREESGRSTLEKKRHPVFPKSRNSLALEESIRSMNDSGRPPALPKRNSSLPREESGRSTLENIRHPVFPKSRFSLAREDSIRSINDDGRPPVLPKRNSSLTREDSIRSNNDDGRPQIRPNSTLTRRDSGRSINGDGRPSILPKSNLTMVRENIVSENYKPPSGPLKSTLGRNNSGVGNSQPPPLPPKTRTPKVNDSLPPPLPVKQVIHLKNKQN